ncbi:MBL fold metallo-hydrolase [Polymorphobacter fuscus]|uniref:MBL fold metallo-hydrolase n=1 Tax=Sandarakinorhabdus fusca TaxID=1439888 RepID=A0A7C9GQ59_9SPHN|nr:MBL fold metallo-hydrolase [Polymorphobacter fuscus]KAB7645587.1 MBL fold metallo-hydrolase [Polymorphobacter fuscus]MQT18035.1 MBL fold metallo-hydrolase [Polymorphobacter fuscus]NJC08668.1 glyoxylase-like metal-dependent hydrolase (beta-lactamase superfamily II) [Polymorphobacter fuscus]
MRIPALFALALAAPALVAPALDAPAFAQVGPVTVQPEATDFRIGAYQLSSLRDAGNIAPNDAKVFGVDAGIAEVDKVLVAAGATQGQIELSVNALLIRLPGHVALIDTGYGMPRGTLLASLEKAGTRADAVTDIMITHGHGDHVGGLVGPDGKPAFANAVVHLSAPEWDAIKSQPNNAKLVAAIGTKVKPFTPGAKLLPGITAVDLHGHTAGHSGYEIVSGKARLMAIGDSAHSYIVSLARPDWVMGYDKDAAVGAANRATVLGRLADSREPVFSPHFPYPGVGRVVRAGSGFKWQPGLPQ